MQDNHRRRVPARVVGSISARRGVVDPNDMPVVQVGVRAVVRGVRCQVHAASGEHVTLTHRLNADPMPVGLMLHWLGFAWRVCRSGTTQTVLEAWGRTYLDSPKLELYARG